MNHETRFLFHELVELSAGERERVFRERRIGAALRAEVESLLSFDSMEVEGLTDRVSNAAGDVLRTLGGPELSHCGPYRLVRLLGSGGMGAVYLAERSDGEIQQEVAVKLLRADGNRPAWHHRFLRERQLLASLHHPSIVCLIDAGHTTDGRPFLVMEYVEGVPVDVYAAGMDVRGRLKLFLRICEGVSHAHRCLIVHRDLKPSNILVDASGQPKLLDFGIAKLLDETGDATQTVERMLTPHYASPEQFSGAAQTTATDVYSLGAVLYKLLSGAAPRENAPHALKAEIAPPSRVNPDVPRDVDFIVRKALRVEPEERYVSVDEFANDVRAALDWRPVQARSGDAWYRTRRFLRRYWLPVAAAMLVVASLSAGLYVANRERAIADRRFVEVRQLANKLFDIDAQVAQLAGGSKTRQLIVDTSLEYLRRLTADVRMDPGLALDVGTAYMRVARVQGINISPNLGQTEQADRTIRKAQALIDSVLASQPANRTALLRSAQIAHDRMILAGDRHRDDDALKFAQKSAERLEQYLGTGNLDGKSDRLEAQQVIITQMNVAGRYMLADQLDEALRISRRAIDIARATNWPAQAGAALMVVALAHRARGDLDEALQAIRESVRILEPSAGEKTTGRLLTFALALIREGQILGEDNAISLGRSEDAIECLRRGFDIAEDFARRDSSDFRSRLRVFTAGTKLADILRQTRPQRALDMYDHVLQRLAEAKDNAGSRLNETRTLAASTYPLQRLGRTAEARKRMDAAFERLGQLKLYPADQIELGSEADEALRALADFEAGNGNVRRAAEVYQELLARVLAANPKPETSLIDAVNFSNIYRAAAPLHRRLGQADVAAALELRRLELWQRWNRKHPSNAFVRRQLEAARLP
jgi:tetratricopeptide (TPR) repeat protein/predicted Ser/Thr protein kinase